MLLVQFEFSESPKFIESVVKKLIQENPGNGGRFQPVIAGSELGNGFSELNDPVTN